MPAFIDGAPVRTVNEISTMIQRQAAPAEPLLVYLRPADVGAAIARIHRTRREPWSSQNVAFVEDSPWARRRNLQGQGLLGRSTYRIQTGSVHSVGTCAAPRAGLSESKMRSWAMAAYLLAVVCDRLKTRARCRGVRSGGQRFVEYPVAADAFDGDAVPPQGAS
jgi:hypothetical protein